MYGFKIESNIPPPKMYSYKFDGSPKPVKSKYPFADFNVGDSMFVETTDQKRLTNNLRCNAYNFCKRAGLNWKWLSYPEGNGVRLWRTK